MGELGVDDGRPAAKVSWAERETEADEGDGTDGVGRGLLSAKSNTRITASAWTRLEVGFLNLFFNQVNIGFLFRQRSPRINRHVTTLNGRFLDQIHFSISCALNYLFQFDI